MSRAGLARRSFTHAYGRWSPVICGYKRASPMVPTRVGGVPLDEALLAEMRETKAAIDELQEKLKALVAELRAKGATSQEIAEALRA